MGQGGAFGRLVGRAEQLEDAVDLVELSAPRQQRLAQHELSEDAAEPAKTRGAWPGRVRRSGGEASGCWPGQWRTQAAYDHMSSAGPYVLPPSSSSGGRYLRGAASSNGGGGGGGGGGGEEAMTVQAVKGDRQRTRA